MAYSVKNTRNVEVDTVSDSTLKTTQFGIQIPGKNYVGYGEAVAQTLLHILENHAAPNSGSDTPNPSNPNVDLSSPVDGQLWYDTTNRKLRVWDSVDSAWNISSGAAAVAPTSTPPSSPSTGDLWWNTTVSQLFGYTGSAWNLVGPINPSTDINKLVNLQINVGGSGGAASGTAALPSGGTNYDAVGVLVGNVLVGIWVDTALATTTYFYTPLNDGTGNATYYSFNVYGTSGLLKGLNIGENTSSYWFNGKSKAAENADQLNSVVSTNFIRNDNGSGASTSRLPSAGGLNLGGSGNRWGTVYATTFDGTATAAQYADLAERYETDFDAEVGDVVILGGTKEVTRSSSYADNQVLGIVSQNPAYLMNNNVIDPVRHPPIAMSGRVPCKVKGTVKKGDRLVTSDEPGVAVVADLSSIDVFSVIGRALEDKNTSEIDLVEVVVGKL